MKNKVIISYKAKKQLKKIDNYTANLIVHWLKKNIDGCEDPRVKGKGLTANRSGEWRYRVGDYRILCDIQDNIVIVYVLEIGHRSKIYD